jgi:hypothetical protein
MAEPQYIAAAATSNPATCWRTSHINDTPGKSSVDPSMSQAETVIGSLSFYRDNLIEVTAVCGRIAALPCNTRLILGVRLGLG